MDYAHIIDENDTLLNVVGYFNVDHELEWWMLMLMNIFLYFLWIFFSIKIFFEVLAQMANYIG
jgi:hypothetical protein